MNQPNIIGLDLSLRGAGIAVNGHAETIHAPKPPARNTTWRALTPAERRQTTTDYRHQRLHHINTALVDRYLAGGRIHLAVLEGLAYEAHDTDRQLAGLSWIVRDRLWRMDIPYAVVPPMTLKQFATGTGAATKTQVRDQVADWFPWFNGDDNAADASVLMAMGYAALKKPLTGPLSAVQVAAMGKAAWPDMDALKAAEGVEVAVGGAA